MKTFSLQNISFEYFGQFINECPGDMLKDIFQKGPSKYIPEILKVKPDTIRHLDPKCMLWLTSRKIEKFNQIAVTSSSWVILHIKNPSEKVCLIAVEKDCSVFKKIKYPTLKVQRAALNKWHTMDRKVIPSDSVSYDADCEDSVITLLIYDNPKPRMEFLMFLAKHYPRYFYTPYNRPFTFLIDSHDIKYKEVFPWDRVPKDFQQRIITEDFKNYFKIPEDKLLPGLKKKYSFIPAMSKAGVLK